MGHSRSIHLAGRSTAIGCVVALLALGYLAPLGLAQEPAPGPVTRVEEDWVVEMNEPSYDETSPQITNTISPTPNLNCKFGLFELNHGTQPEYRDGGLELQIWDHDNRVNYRRHTNTNRLNYANEMVKYTLSMYIWKSTNGGSNRLVFKVKNGESQTWGTFGNDSTLRCSIETTRQDLTNYSPQFSVDNSRVGYASFRVRKYALIAVRYYDANGLLVRTDDTERVAHEYSAESP